MTYKVTLNDKTYEVEVEQGAAMLLDEYTTTKSDSGIPLPDLGEKPSGSEEWIISPLPGNVLSLKIKLGDIIKAGDILLVLEAMKMETEIVAEKGGIVAQIQVTEGSAVDTGTALIALK